MLHDEMLADALSESRTSRATTQAGNDLADRRAGDRLPFPAELILLWHHDPDSRHRYRILDASDGGYRIRSALPMHEGTTGTVLRVLTCSMRCTAQPVMVAWCRRAAGGSEGYEVGLKRF